MKRPQFGIRDLFWSVTLFAVGCSCLYPGRQGASWSTFWLIAATTAFGAGCLAPLREKVAGMACGLTVAAAVLMFQAINSTPTTSSTGFRRFVDYFVWQPGHIWAIASAFGVLFLATLVAKARCSRIRCLPLLVAFLAWLTYGFWEREAFRERANIRIDLPFIGLFLFSTTAIAIILSIQSVLRVFRDGQSKRPSALETSVDRKDLA